MARVYRSSIDKNKDPNLPGITYKKHKTIQQAFIFMFDKPNFNVPLVGSNEPIPPPDIDSDVDSEEELWREVGPLPEVSQSQLF